MSHQRVLFGRNLLSLPERQQRQNSLLERPHAIRNGLRDLRRWREPDHAFACDGRDDVKPNTLIAYKRSQRQLERFFGGDRLIETITEGDADDFKQWLLRNSARATAAREIKRSRQFFKAAVRLRLISTNPFDGIKAGAQTNPARKHFVERADIEAVIAACPNAEWRLIFAFARYAGLRIPSELDELKWSDINWDRGRFTVAVPKKAHLDGHETRVIPIFAELRPFLEAAFDEAQPGSVYVVPRAHGCPNLRRYAEQIIRKAGVKQWPKLFTNCRASRETELIQKFPAHVVHSWIGHTASVAEDHYLQVREQDFGKAIQAAQIPAQSLSVRGHLEPSDGTEKRKKRLKNAVFAETQYPREESNNTRFSREKPHSPEPPGADSGAMPAGLAEIVAAWPHLPTDLREEILALAHSAAKPA